MGWQCELISCRLVAFIVLAASSILQLEGFNLAPSPVSFGYHSQKASSPSQLSNSGSASAPTLVSFPKVFSPTFGAAAPSINPVIPSVMSPSPSSHLASDDQWSRAVAPAIEGHPYAPVPSVLPSPNQSRPSPFNKTPITPRVSPKSASPRHAIYFHGSAPPPLSVTPSVGSRMRNGMPVASPPVEVYGNSPSSNISPTKGSNKDKPSNLAQGPSSFHRKPPAISISDGPALAPGSSGQQRRATNGVVNHSAPLVSPISPPSYLSGPIVTPAPEVFPKYNQMHHASPPSQHAAGSAFFLPHAPAPILPSLAPQESNEWSSASHKTTPDSYPGASNNVPPVPVWVLPPPPPNTDCKSLVCDEHLTNPMPGSPCICVLPIRVGLRLSVTLYTFFPLVPKFAQEIAYEIYMKTSQVRIMGANVADELPENTIVLLDLVPAKDKFDKTTAFSIFEKFWNKDIAINTSLFGDYTVLFVLYPGYPPSPPGVPVDNNADGTSANNYNARMIKPLGVDLRKSEAKKKAGGNLVAVIVLSSCVALLLCVGAAWYLLLKKRGHSHLGASNMPQMLPSFANSSGTKHAMLGNRFSSDSASFSSTYTGQAKIFTSAEVERATNRFDERRVIGEGGFGRVYEGTLEDGLRVAVKVLKRDDQQGGREFFAEIEMLSRLHHRNLVKLIGICIEEHIRCLVYELIPNGSLESHLHGLDKEAAPLDWNARMKIALGAARGLAYLHEDSNPRVIHRDFKSSNILLEYNYTPKVSDFGLARAAVDEGNLHISTQIMGTFGYVAPEYAMTGHLLVKSDVYSYGVVLLELLTGRKPVNMLQPPGQENLVAWARPLLTNMDNLETIIDPALGKNVPLDSVAKVAAIASMCVQPEVSHRPFMGEVVQALNLVCHECDENKGAGTCSRDTAARLSSGLGLEAERLLLESYLLSTSTRFDGDESSFQRHSSTGPLITSKKRKFWERLRSTSTGTMSEHGAALRFGTSTYFVDLWS